MSTTHPGEPSNGSGAVPEPDARRPLHRLAEVRRQQGLSRRTVARHLKTDVLSVRRQETAEADLPLSQLYQWQAVLDVPLAELLVDTDEPLSAPVFKRAQLVRLMKTAKAILEQSRQLPIQRMAQVLVDQLSEVMPELGEVTSWHVIGKRRTPEETGRAAQQWLQTDFFVDTSD